MLTLQSYNLWILGALVHGGRPLPADDLVEDPRTTSMSAIAISSTSTADLPAGRSIWNLLLRLSA